VRTIEEIDRDIEEIKSTVPEGTPTETYTRIVGYYRSLRNWNRGKREEYDRRMHFDPDSTEERVRT
jgi:hypothetical protein